MNRVVCLTQSLRDIPADECWLTQDERSVLAGLRFTKRREDWLLGRWTAKQALALCAGDTGAAPGRWEILADQSGAPQVRRDGMASDLVLSISHSSGMAFCSASDSCGSLGCDIEYIEPRDPAFLETFFTAHERDRVDSAGVDDGPMLATLIWSAKESALKVLKSGLRADTRSVEVESVSSARPRCWQPFRVRHAESREVFDGWWRRTGSFVFTVSADSAMDKPASPSLVPAAGIGDFAPARQLLPGRRARHLPAPVPRHGPAR